ncbi:MAG: HAD hydrolase-like protein [Clostridia bacterium]|nr:HAD hydrolase-like protein [Clostridia bacterium]
MTLQSYEKKREYLVCVDSDGCAMDTMDIKHILCFGPCMVDEWGLDPWREEILKRWNDINLYTITRGINRFKGLAMALDEIDRKYTKIEGIDDLVAWAEISPELSNSSVQREIDANPDSVIFKKALSWSRAVNLSINALPNDKKLPFPLVREALQFAHGKADVAIVSSANLDAVIEEWEMHRLLEHTDIVLAQNVGSKAYCISELIKKGYEKRKVIMCGDALGDMQAAERNGVYFYPILVKHEGESWQEFMDVGLQRLIEGSYAGPYQAEKRKQFLKNLGQ